MKIKTKAVSIFDTMMTKMWSDMEQKEMIRVYVTLLATPGMNDSVKLDLRISRKLVLLLSQVVERGLMAGDNILTSVDKEAAGELQKLLEGCLFKLGLVELAGKRNQLGDGKCK